jgi:hypothetical protein
VLFQFLFFQANNEAGFSLVPGLAVPRPFRNYTLTIRNWWTSSKHNKRYCQNKHHNMCKKQYNNTTHGRFHYIIYHQLINTIYRWTDYIFWKKLNGFKEECKISLQHISPSYSSRWGWSQQTFIDKSRQFKLVSWKSSLIGLTKKMTNFVIILDNITLYNNGRNRERSQYLTCISTGIEMNDWCLTPTLTIFQLYRGVNIILINLRHLPDP